jgi:hypothetical protein
LRRGTPNAHQEHCEYQEKSSLQVSQHVLALLKNRLCVAVLRWCFSLVGECVCLNIVRVSAALSFTVKVRGMVLLTEQEAAGI